MTVPQHAENLNNGYWPAPRMWAGGMVYIIGGGPSLAGVDLSPIHSRKVIGVNQAFQLGQWVDVCYFGDERWYRHNKEALIGYGGVIVSSAVHGYLRTIPRIKMLKRDNRFGVWTKTQDKVCWNLSTGGSAVNLAVLLGAKKIILLGFDMKAEEDGSKKGKHNWHKKHARFHTPAPTIYEEKFLPPFKHIRRDLDEMGIECLNANPDSALNDFKKITLAEAMK